MNSGQLETHELSIYRVPATSPGPKQVRVELRMELGAGRSQTHPSSEVPPKRHVSLVLSQRCLRLTPMPPFQHRSGLNRERARYSQRGNVSLSVIEGYSPLTVHPPANWTSLSSPRELYHLRALDMLCSWPGMFSPHVLPLQSQHLVNLGISA